MKKISIIIPIYNCHKYLAQLLEIIDKQIEGCYEVILIDDCSNDNSREIILKYKDNSNYKLFFNSKNKGVSYSRNVGLDNALGEYIVFIDADDSISDDYFSIIKDNLKHDLIIFGTKMIYKDSEKNINVMYKEYLTRDYIFSNDIILDISMAQWVTNKVFKKEIIDKYKLRFNEKLQTGEDLLFMLNYFEKMENAFCINKCLYHYNRTNIDSLTRVNIINIVENTKNNNDMIEKFFIKHNLSCNYLNKYKTDLFIYVLDTVYRSTLDYCDKINLFKKNIELNYFKELNKYCNEKLFNIIISKSLENLYKYMEEKWKK